MPFPKTDEELAKAGYKFEGTSRCSGPTCHAEIAWYRTPSGKRIRVSSETEKRFLSELTASLRARFAEFGNPLESA